jgi:transposase-like protein
MNSKAPCLHGTVQFRLDGSSGEHSEENSFISFDFPIVCPRCRTQPARLEKVGREAKIKGRPQRYHCQVCGRYFMAHTSAFWLLQRDEFIARLLQTRYTEARSFKSLCREYQLSTGQLARLLQAFWKAVLVDACRLEQLEHQWLGLSTEACHQIRTIWVDETFIKIQGQTWYLIVAVDKIGRVIHHRLLDNRSENALCLFWDELTEKCPHIQLIVTDGISGYERMCKNQKQRLFHIQHIHKDDRRQVQVTQYDYDWERGLHSMKQVGMTNDGLLTNESTLVHYIEKEEKDRTVKRPKGRLKGRKDSKPRKKRADQPQVGPPTGEMSPSPPQKRGRKNVFRDGRPYVLDSLTLNGGLGVVSLQYGTNKSKDSPFGAVFQVFTLIMVAAQTFPGVHITSNRIETCFSRFDAWQETRGRRTVRTVDRDTTLFFTYDAWQSRLMDLVKKMDYRLSTYPPINTFPGRFTFNSTQESLAGGNNLQEKRM